jgi:4-carboxymuconolactone decarboxylase
VRLDAITADSMTPEQLALYEAIVGEGRSPRVVLDERGVVQGPFTAMLNNPRVGHAVQALGGALRFTGMLPDRARELVILTVACAWRSEFEWWSHVRIGGGVGLSDAEIAAVLTGAPIALTDPIEAATLEVARALVLRGDLDDDEYSEAIRVLGPAQVVEITALVGYYALIALQLRVFRVSVPDGIAPAFAPGTPGACDIPREGP